MQIMLVAIAATVDSIAVAQPKPTQPLLVEKYDGYDVTVMLTSTIRVNGDSTLKREWYIVNDPSAPVTISERAGVLVIYDDTRRSAGFFKYSAVTSLKHPEPLVAVEIRMHLFDAFGRHITTLAKTSMRDRKAGESSIDGDWQALNEAEAAEVYSSVLYVSRARSASGRVYAIDHAALLPALKKIGARIVEGDLEPKR